MKQKLINLNGLDFIVEFETSQPDPSTGYRGEHEIHAIYYGSDDFTYFFECNHILMNEIIEML
jgi:hypothetical protein